MRKILLAIYQIGIRLYGFAIRVASLFNPKAKKWIEGRRNWKQEFTEVFPTDRQVYWFHCASLGEFEQGRPVMEKLKERNPDCFLLVTFFSPSGYEIRKNYSLADFVSYLPLDIPSRMRWLVELVQPQFVAIIKYELWLNWLKLLRNRRIPHFLISAAMRPESNFIKGPMASLYREALLGFHHIFTQDEQTLELLQFSSSEMKVSVSGDTRFDRVADTRKRWTAMEEIEKFVDGRFCIVAGSTWPKGEEVILEAFEKIRSTQKICLIIAPHEIHQDRIQNWISRNADISTTYSDLKEASGNKQILWIDNIGMLSRLYGYADIAYVGGAWHGGLHNILEPLTFGCKVVIGPRYEKYQEAVEFIEYGYVQSIDNAESLAAIWEEIIRNDQQKKDLSRKIKNLMISKTGATSRILKSLESQGLIPYTVDNR